MNFGIRIVMEHNCFQVERFESDSVEADIMFQSVHYDLCKHEFNTIMRRIDAILFRLDSFVQTQETTQASYTPTGVNEYNFGGQVQ